MIKICSVYKSNFVSAKFNKIVIKNVITLINDFVKNKEKEYVSKSLLFFK